MSQPGAPVPLPAPPELPAGVQARAATREDAPAIFALLRADELTAVGESSVTLTEVEHWFEGKRTSERGTIRVLERSGALVGFIRVFRNFDDKYYVQVVVDRTLPAGLRDDLWREGLAWAQAIAVAVADALGVAFPRLDAGVIDTDSLGRDHLAAAGYQPVRAYIEMHVDLDGYPARPIDPRVSIRPAIVDAPDAPDLHTVYEVITTSFRDHFDFALRPFDEWVQNRFEDPLNDPRHWLLADVDGVPVGALIGHNAYLQSDNAGYVANLGVLREGRGKGVAKGLLQTSFARYAADGRSAVKLHVDAESPTGATHLYEAVGMRRRLVYLEHFAWPNGRADS